MYACLPLRVRIITRFPKTWFVDEQTYGENIRSSTGWNNSIDVMYTCRHVQPYKTRNLRYRLKISKEEELTLGHTNVCSKESHLYMNEYSLYAYESLDYERTCIIWGTPMHSWTYNHTWTKLCTLVTWLCTIVLQLISNDFY